MPQPVPAHARQPELLTSWLELPIDEVVPIEWCPRPRAKHQSVGIPSGWLKSRKNLDGLCPQRNPPLAALTLGLIEVTFGNALGTESGKSRAGQKASTWR